MDAALCIIDMLFKAQINLYAARRILHCRIDDEHIMLGGLGEDPLSNEHTVYKREALVAPYIKEILGDFM